MKKIIVLCMSMMLWLPGLVSAQQALQIVRVNTDDVAAYLDWAEDSSEALLGDNVGAVGTCVPVFGADNPGDVIFFTVNPNQESLFGVDFNNPVLQQEIAKISDIRRVVSRDVHLTIRQGGAPGSLGRTSSQALFFVETTPPARYIELLNEMERRLHANGFDDVSWAAYQVLTGSDTNKVVSTLRAPTRARVGAALDAIQFAPWSNFDAEEGGFDNVRTLVHAYIADCEIYASNQ